MRTLYLAGAVCTTIGLLLTQARLTLAAETCPIYSIETDQMEPVPTLTAWSLGDEISGTIRAEDDKGVVNIREDAGMEFDVVTTAQPAEAIMMTDHALSTDCRNWFKVTFADGRIGWVHGRYVESDRAFSPF